MQVCVLLLVVGAAQLLTTSALLQLRCFSRSSLFLYSAYGGSISEKRKREKAAAAVRMLIPLSSPRSVLVWVWVWVWEWARRHTLPAPLHSAACVRGQCCFCTVVIG